MLQYTEYCEMKFLRKQTFTNTGQLTPNDLLRATDVIVKSVQEKEFPQQIQQLSLYATSTETLMPKTAMRKIKDLKSLQGSIDSDAPLGVFIKAEGYRKSWKLAPLSSADLVTVAEALFAYFAKSSKMTKNQAKFYGR